MKIFDMLVHEGHQYELCKLGCDFTVMTDESTGKVWDTKMRPVPSNVTFVDKVGLSIKTIESHDLAIIRNYRQFKLLENCRLPKIIVMHCSRHGQGNVEFVQEDLSNYTIVFCSHKDKERWNLASGRQHVIYPGLDPNEWPISQRTTNRVFTVGRMIKERSKICGFKIVEEFQRSRIPVSVVGDNPAIQVQAPGSFEAFKRNHERYAVYLNPTLRSPQPRGRVEAMMSGIPIVTTAFYDESSFIENGINGFFSNNAQQLKEYAVLLLNDRTLQESMATKSRQTAVEHFHIDRFLGQWREIIEEMVGSANIPIIKARPTNISMTRKDSSGGGGTVTSNNVVEGLKKSGYNVSCLDINSKGWVSFVNDIKLPATGDRIFENYIRQNPCDVLIFDDVARYILCKDSIDPHCRVFLCLLGNPQVHSEHWASSGVNLNDPDNRIERILCRPVYAKFLKVQFGDERVISWVGGCDGEALRREYGSAQYRSPQDGALVISAHRGTDWWKNPTTSFLAAYGLSKTHPGLIYFKPSGNEMEKQFLKHSPFDIQYGGTRREGMEREKLLRTMACAQLAIEPGYSEGFSRSCNEMMNFGIPVIQGPNAQHLRQNELLSKYLLLNDGSDIQELVEKSSALLEDKELWEQVSAECIEFSAQYDIQQEVATLLEALGDEDHEAGC